ncbi:hypothetical protein ALNOE001_01140 [Candidatus Methanobinarius endosymbioticus]|uniref:Right handed beta helix domain-containing protein n=1 Tax=Candidatus Methanobinarius endosymbioticus TaxID=2006182 RepID=A0A366MEJ5_9EURY|nr:hypothetical protein ALNOE001_01140 [Candidatus Methanobinarius endosymbioticus]
MINDANKTENSNIFNVKIKNNSINTFEESVNLLSESQSSENKVIIKNVSIENNKINSENKEGILIESNRNIEDIKIKNNDVKSKKRVY